EILHLLGHETTQADATDNVSAGAFVQVRPCLDAWPTRDAPDFSSTMSYGDGGHIVSVQRGNHVRHTP
ncbi:MAG: hypothetical protein L0H93_19930, partial [Nocardioides sp.]|nr:hypothetical protein [Nocardioides sp.]